MEHIEYVRIPPEMVRVSKYPEPEELTWDESEIEIQLAVRKAVEEFYEDQDGLCIE